MKKILTILLSIAMIFALVGCSSSDSGTTDGGTTDGGSSDSGVEDVAVFWYTFADDYISTVRAALNKQFDEAGVSYKDYDGNGNQTDQTNQINTALAAGVKVIVVNQVESNSVDTTKAILDAAKAASAKCIFFNRSISEDDAEAEELLNSYDSAFIGTDYTQAGHLEGKMIGEYLVANYDAADLNGDGVISYVMLKGQEGNTEAIARTQYSVEDANAALEAAGKKDLAYYDSAAATQYLVDANGTWSQEAAFNHLETVLSQYNEENGNMPELIIANNDSMALGAIQSLQGHGYNNGEGTTTIPVFGVDAIDAAKSAIDAGTMTGTVKQDGEGMALVICLATQNVIAGLEPAKDIPADYETVGTWRVNIPYSAYTK